MDDENDEDLWGYITRKVKPIRREQGLEVSKPKKPVVALHPEDPNIGESRPGIIQPPVLQKRGDGGHGLDRRSAERLRKGQMPIEGRLDLHGMSQAQAHTALERFILQSQAGGKRCVLVITGKGNDADGRRDPLSKGQGILRRMVPEWLGQSPLREHILRTEKARPQHGGEGALYVLLRRSRDGV